MGTDTPPVTIRAATLSGGKKNQDRYAHGEDWAFVLDGASSFDSEQPEHDGGWYAERLMTALIDGLTGTPSDDTVSIVARAITSAAAGHDDPLTCPTSTISLARWGTETVELYVLGDSTAAFTTFKEDGALTDSRMAAIASNLRDLYRRRLQAGHGFDAEHREVLRRLQAEQTAARNIPGGYWIAGATPAAARQGLTRTLTRQGPLTVVLATDGAATGLRYGLADNWSDSAIRTVDEFLARADAEENRDPTGAKWPRSKLHDDKTLVHIRFAEEARHRSAEGVLRLDSNGHMQSPAGRLPSHATDSVARRLTPQFEGIAGIGRAYADLNNTAIKALAPQVEGLAAASRAIAGFQTSITPQLEGIAGIGRAYADLNPNALAAFARNLVDSHARPRQTPRRAAPPPGSYELGDALDSEGFFHLSPDIDSAIIAQLAGRQLITPRDIDVAEWLTAFTLAATAVTGLVVAAALSPLPAWTAPLLPAASPLEIWQLIRRIKLELERRRITP